MNQSADNVLVDGRGGKGGGRKKSDDPV